MDLGIIVVSWNVRDLLAACLESVYADLERSRLSAAVWVVDNGSADGSTDMAAGRFPEAKVIANADNRGFAAANNQALWEMGLGQAQGTRGKGQGAPAFATRPTPVAPLQSPHASHSTPPFAALLLNPDTVVKPGALQALVDFLSSTPRAGVAGAALVNPDGSPQECAFEFPGLWQAALDLFPPTGPWRRLANSRLNGRYPRRLFERGEPFPIGHPLGAAFAARGEAVAQVGLLDAGYHMYCEEIDWAWRMRRTGWQAYCVPGSEVIHYGGQSARQAGDEAFVNLWRSRKRLYERYHGRLTVALVGGLVRLAMTRRARSGTGPGPYLEVAQVWR